MVYSVIGDSSRIDDGATILDDLRRKLLGAYDEGKGSLSELAERFGVSLAWAWKISATRKRTGQMERPSYRPGAKRRIDERALAGLLRSHADATLVELQAELESKTGLRFSAQICGGW